jgi:4-aminobutyrate aminotransferase-like enzyme
MTPTGATSASASQEVVEKHKKYLFPAVITYYEQPLPIERASGMDVWDFDGKKYLDFFGGILTVSVGHSHPKVSAAVKAQVDKLVHVSTLYPNKPQADLAEKIANLMPTDSGLTSTFFTNSGSEADETAVLLAKMATGSNTIVGLRHGYAGRTVLARQLTAHAGWRGVDDEMAGVKHGHPPYCYRCPFKASPDTCSFECATDLEELIQTTTPGHIAAFLGETIQGVGGFITPPKDYFKVAVPIIKKYGGLFICDEVQAGWGRTGDKWWGFEHYCVTPDIVTSAKGMGNGFAIAMTTTRPDLAKKWKGLTISTFGGNPVSTAASMATIQVMEEENLVRNAAVVGGYLREKLEALKEKHTLIGDVRGMGLMQAMELVTDRKTKEPAKAQIARLMEETRKKGLLIGKGGLYGNVVRIAPPMTCTKAQVDDAVKIIDEGLTACR